MPNPLSYEVDALRALTPIGGESKSGIPWDLAVLLCVTCALAVTAAKLYRQNHKVLPPRGGCEGARC
jgi:hypothetical protein